MDHKYNIKSTKEEKTKMTLRFSVLSNDATYQLSRSAPSVNEDGSTITIILNTTGVQNQQIIPYVISGAGITTADFDGVASLTGNFIIVNGVATLPLTVRADLAVEGAETFTVTLENGASISVDINDTSGTPIVSYWIVNITTDTEWKCIYL